MALQNLLLAAHALGLGASGLTGPLVAEDQFRALLESAPDAIVLVDPQGRILMVNAQTERLFGFDRSELFGQGVEMLVPKRFADRHSGHRQSFLLDPRVRPMEARLDLYGQRRDGSEFPVEIGLNPIRTGAGLMVLASIIDITERRRAADAAP
jgi:protein-histidine pros-kinase